MTKASLWPEIVLLAAALALLVLFAVVTAAPAPTRQLKPSQTRHACARQEKKPFGQRWHACGVSCSRDVNAARVLLSWIEQWLSGREPAEAWRAVSPRASYGCPGTPVETRNSRHSLKRLGGSSS